MNRNEVKERKNKEINENHIKSRNMQPKI